MPHFLNVGLRWLFWFALILLFGCSPSGRVVDEATRDGVLLLGNGAEPRDLDPQTVTGMPDVKVISSLLEGLVTYNPVDDAIPNPGVAERWSVSEDGCVWRFFLREDARWSNGDAVLASDFVFAWRRAIEPELACEYADWLYIIEGAETYHRGVTTDFSTVGIKAPAPRVFEVRLTAPTANFLKILLNHTFLPVHPGTVEATGGATRRQSGWTRAGTFVGNGAFVLAEWSPNQVIRVVPNPYYWDAARVRLNEIRFFPISDEYTEMRAFESGQLHVTNSVPVNRRSWYRENEPALIRFDDFGGVYFYRLNTTRPPLDDPRVRTALSLAIDRRQIVESLLRGGERVAHGYTPDGIDGYETPEVIKYDPERARRLLAEAGFPGGKDFPELELLFNTSDNHRTLAEAIQQMWREELGIRITLANQEWQVFLNTAQKMDYDVSRAGWVGSVYALSFLRNYLSNSPNNETGFSDPVYDSLLDAAQHEMSRPMRHRLLREAEIRLLEARPVIPLYWYTNVFLIDPAVRNWHPKLNDLRPFKDVYLQPVSDE